MLPHERLRQALENAEKPALIAFLTAGYPTRERFLETLAETATVADAVEIGVPFTDPMADGVTIQRSSHAALAQGVSLRWILDLLASRDVELRAPILLMSYLNPLLAFGLPALAARCREVGVSGLIVPDLPLEESGPLRAALEKPGLALVQLVTPATPPERLAILCKRSRGFIYAVTRTGITGTGEAMPPELAEYLAAVGRVADLPVCAGFGVRTPQQVRLIGAHADGVIVGSALIEALERQVDVRDFLNNLRGRASAEPGE